MDSTPIVVQNYAPRSPQLRIAVVTETYPPEINGVAMTIGRMMEGLRQRGHHVQLVRPRQSPQEVASNEKAFVEVLAQGMSIPRYQELKLGLPARSLLLQLWQTQRPDIVHVVTEGPLGWSAISAARKLRLPISSDFHTNFDSYSRHYGIGWLKHPISAYLRKLHNRSDLTLVPTQAMRSDLSRKGYQRLHVVARGVDTQLFNPSRRSMELRNSWGVANNGLAVIHVGRLAPEKNLQLVLRTFKVIVECRPDARLVFVGDGPERAALQKAHPQHIFCGMRSGEDLASHYASGDIFLFPSLTETFGNVTLEAMASGLGVVAYDYAAAGELICSQQNGMLAALGDEAAYIDAALSLATDPPLLAAVRQQAAASIAKHDWEHIYDEFATTLADTVRSSLRKQHAKTAFILAPD